MDPLVHLMDGPRARSAFTLRVVMGPPWAIDVRDGAALALVVVTGGRVWLRREGVDPVPAGPGDVLLVRGPEPYVVSGDPDTTPRTVVEPGNRCVDLDGRELRLSMGHGVGTWGNDAEGPDTMIIGAYEDTGEIGRLALAALPPLAVLPAGSVDAAVVALLTREITTARVAQSALNDRLLDCLLVMSVRAWLESHPDSAPNWLSGRHDPVVARALDLVHEHPDHAWTLDALARRCAVSRATLAARFTRGVGDPPMSYLRNWRLTLACDLLVAEPDLGLGSLAARVGYGSAFAFSTAFKNRFGASPTEYRRAKTGAAHAVGVS
ncbi:AraC family transcriptional regulator [Nocardiopsis sp. MG754419]|uniref:AraC family transcriptional regulator n=1 Tax=Nocardiopsis sp. MG754419 TaxID=2259865 RepID=UPI001BAB14B9|nr:AraC family transcriptional regulator [Nocardiopsis sp. MG754419]MBR8744098.1 AraC family transcriptional regulator [Nocardiopsis sp. MG754419]